MRIWWWQTTCVVLVPITTHIPSFINVAQTELWIFDFFVISQSEQICKWGIKYAHSVTIDHIGRTCAHTTTIPSFINVAHTELLIFDFFVISQSEQICKWGIRYAHSVTKDHVGSTCAPHYPHTKFDKNCYCVLIRERRFTFWCWRDLTSVHTSVHPYRQRYNWKLSGPSSIAGGPQKRNL